MADGYSWFAGEGLLQFLIVPETTPELELLESVSKTERGTGGSGSSGK